MGGRRFLIEPGAVKEHIIATWMGHGLGLWNNLEMVNQSRVDRKLIHCGIFAMKYYEEILKQPSEFEKKLRKNKLKDWVSSKDIPAKRLEVVEHLKEEAINNSLVELPLKDPNVIYYQVKTRANMLIAKDLEEKNKRCAHVDTRNASFLKHNMWPWRSVWWQLRCQVFVLLDFPGSYLALGPARFFF